jgi:APA family basic amino acid/polyamine antiporter
VCFIIRAAPLHDAPVTTLARKLRTTDYFTLGWGTMVGVGWLVVMDDWLARGGAVGALLGFLIGGLLLLPIGWVYGRLVIAMPDAAGEIAYTSAVFPRWISFSTGWMMTLAYFIVCPWEAVAVGRIAAYIFPILDSMEVYRVAGRPVYLPHLIVGLALTALLTILNYRGVRLSASFQNWTSFGTLGLFMIFVSLGASRGSAGNFAPLFTRAPVVSILAVIQIVPYFMTGFESVGKAAEEASPEFRSSRFFRAIWMAIVIGIAFYASIVAAVAFVAPWHTLLGEKFMTAVAFQQALGSRWIVNVILAAALLSLFKCFNGNFVGGQPAAFRSRPARDDYDESGSNPFAVSNAIHRGGLRRHRHGPLHAARRCDSHSCHGGWIGCVRDWVGRRLRGWHCAYPRSFDGWPVLAA